MHVYRWDLDKTYLETEIDSVRGLVRAAFERADEKRTVPGAAALVRGLVAHEPRSQVVVLSGSPEQMRDVLSRKLELDGVRVDRLILKDNLGNLRRGRFRAVRGQVGYKLPHLLEDRLITDPASRETLFGDDSETDALIYAAYASVLAGTLDRDGLVKLLVAGAAYPDTIERAVEAARRLADAAAGPCVDGIFIRIDRGLPIAAYRLLGPGVMPVFSWHQAALVLFARGQLSSTGLAEVAASAGSVAAVAGWTLDALRRRLVDVDSVHSMIETPGMENLKALVAPEVDRLGRLPELLHRGDSPDLFGFLEAARAHNGG